jgi:hypothetical protein
MKFGVSTFVGKAAMKTDHQQRHESWQTIPALKDWADSANGAAVSSHQTAWQQIIDDKLIEWGRNPASLYEDGLEAPLPQVVRRAIEFARAVAGAGYPPPTSVVPDPNGGIVFERKENGQTEEYHFWDDETVDYCRFEGTRLVERRTV